MSLSILGGLAAPAFDFAASLLGGGRSGGASTAGGNDPFSFVRDLTGAVDALASGGLGGPLESALLGGLGADAGLAGSIAGSLV